MTKICDFLYSYPILTWPKMRHPIYDRCIWHSSSLNIIYEGLLFTVLSIMMKKELLLKKHTQLKTRVSQKSSPIYEQNGYTYRFNHSFNGSINRSLAHSLIHIHSSSRLGHKAITTLILGLNRGVSDDLSSLRPGQGKIFEVCCHRSPQGGLWRSSAPFALEGPLEGNLWNGVVSQLNPIAIHSIIRSIDRLIARSLAPSLPGAVNVNITLQCSIVSNIWKSSKGYK